MISGRAAALIIRDIRLRGAAGSTPDDQLAPHAATRAPGRAARCAGTSIAGARRSAFGPCHGRRKTGRYSAFGPVSGWSGFFDASLPAGIEVEPLASLRGCPPAATSVPSWLHRVWK